MFLLRNVDPDAPTAAVAGAYQSRPGDGVSLMRRILSASPDLLDRVAGLIGHFAHHRTLSPELIAAINYAVASSRGHRACETFNAGRLTRMGMSPGDLAGLLSDPSASPLSATDAALMSFVLKTVSAPDSVGPDDIDRLRAMGLDDADILDATYLGANMVGATVIYKAFYRDATRVA